jgi:hypothetical protein
LEVAGGPLFEGVGKMAIQFNQAVKHGTLQLLPNVPVAFDDAGAEAYFTAAGWAEATDAEPVHTYPEGSAVVDPLTRFGDSGEYVQPEVAEAHIAEYDGNPPPAFHEINFWPGLIAPVQEA